MENNILKNYYFDLNKIMDYVSSGEKASNDTEIAEVYGVNDEGSLSLISKQINESKQGKNDTDISIRYDLFKIMLGMIANITTEEEMTIGEKLCMSTFIENNFIVSKES